MANPFEPQSKSGPSHKRQRSPRRLAAGSAAALLISAGLLSAGCSESGTSTAAGDTQAASSAEAAPATMAPASEQTYADAWGPAAGSQIPMLAAADQTGQPQTLSSLSGGKGLLLVFSRSADW